MSDFNDDDFENVGHEPTKEYTIDEMQEMVEAVRKAEAEKAVTSKANSEANTVLVEAKEKLISCMKEAGLSRWDGTDEYPGFTMSDQLKFRVPQGPQNKAEFFKFLKSEKVSSLLEQDPAEIFLSYATVSSQSLTPLCKKLKELAAENGEDLEIPGLLAPTFEPKLRSIPKRKK